MMYDLCQKQGISHMNCGKWIVAQDETQMAELQKVYDFAKSMDIPIRWVSKQEAKDREPDVRAEAGVLESSSTGIVDSHSYMQFLQGDFENLGGDLALASSVSRIEAPTSSSNPEWTIWAGSDAPPSSGGASSSASNIDNPDQNQIAVTASTLINSAGLYACAISNMALPPSRHITPYYAKGSYYSYSASFPKPKTLVYPAPVPGHGGLGTHLTLDMSGRIRFGPDVEWVDSPTDLAPTYVAERFEAALKDIETYLPGLQRDAVNLDYAGIRPKLGKLSAVGSGGKGFQDFVIRKEEGFPDEAPFVNLLGIESPGLTSSLAIAEEVYEILYRR
jgi:L-2-hydroxyglutarate oxidase LhgO